MSKILITHTPFVDVHVDDYEQGELEHVQTFSVDWFNKGIYNSIEELVKQINACDHAFSADKKDYAFIDGRIYTSSLVDEENCPASDWQIEKWKKGEYKLYTADFNLQVQIVPEVRDMTENDAELMGIDF